MTKLLIAPCAAESWCDMELKPCPFCGNLAEILDNGAGGYKIMCTNFVSCPIETAYLSSKKIAIRVWNNRTRPNPPLTLEQLKNMQGEPVYIVPIKGKDWEKHWSILKDGRVTATSMTVRGRMYFHYLEDYGKTWLAYRRKPESEDEDEFN